MSNEIYKIDRSQIESSIRPCVYAQNASGVLGEYPDQEEPCRFGSHTEGRICSVVFSASVNEDKKTIVIHADNTEDALCDYVPWNNRKYN